jgi:hypothetical protein
MSMQPTQPEPSDWLRLLAGNRLQAQISRSGALDASALGMMAVDVAVALIVIGGGGEYGLPIIALLLLGLSFSLAMRSLRLPNAEETGPTLAAIRRACETEDARKFEDSLLDDFERESPDQQASPGPQSLSNRPRTSVGQDCVVLD